MIDKIIIASFTSIILTTTAIAKEHHAKAGEFYIVTKALMTTSETIKEDSGATLKADVGGGIGVDVGYTLPYHFAVEVDTSYSRNRVTLSENGEKEDDLASY